MKIVHLITSLGMGGAERQLKVLVTDPEKSILEHVIVSMKDEGVIGKHLTGQPGVYIHCLNLHKSIFGFWKLYKILRSERPDILQTWLYHSDFLGTIIGKLARVPHIVWNIRCSNMDLSQYSWRTALIVKILKYLSPLPDAIITNSHAGRTFHTKLGYKPKRWVHIPNGIDTDYFKPNKTIGLQFRRSLGIPDDAIVVGMLGRVDPMKDYPTFLKAMNIISRTHKNIFSIIAGKDTDTANWSLLPPRLFRLGAMEKVPEFLNSLDVMVLSSAYGEGFPNAIGEAMSCGIPTVTTNVGDAALIVQNQAQIVPPGNVEKLVAALNELLSLPSNDRVVLGQEGRERILTLYSLSVMRKRYTSFYKNLD
jgi:glycosyltransferase involved in cell wall biosynthesis